MNFFPAGVPSHPKIGNPASSSFWSLAVPVAFWGAVAALLLAYGYHWADYASLPH